MTMTMVMMMMATEAVGQVPVPACRAAQWRVPRVRPPR
jgi:hypothetical protein